MEDLMFGHEPTHPGTDAPATRDQHGDGSSHRGRHRLLMAICCAPIVVLAVVLIATRVVAPRFLLAAFACMAMMMAMMMVMNRSDTDHGRGRS
jgi:hypothetical protein